MAGITTSELTNMLQEPENITDGDWQRIHTLAEAYPYFVPAQYLEALMQHRGMPYAPEILQRLQLYKGNWLLLNELLSGKHVEVEPLIPPTPTKEDTQENEEEVKSAFEGKEDETIYAESAKEEVAVEAAMSEKEEKEEQVVQPVFTEDYFMHQGVDVSSEMPDMEALQTPVEKEEAPLEEAEDKSLMVVMSFSEWLAFFKNKTEQQKQEEEGQKALKTMWQKEKLAAALEEENEEIPENVFEMAVNSITQEEGLASESLAEIYVKQGKLDKAMDMYRKLSLRNPQKSAYFARKIEILQKEQKS